VTEPTRRVEGLLGITAAVLLPLGLGVIVLGWYGASHSPYLFEQVPYLISGGLLGLGLVTGAGLLYLGSWIARSANTQRAATRELALLLQDIRDELALRPAASGSAESSPNGRGAKFVATARGSMWHRADCSAVAGRADLRTIAPDGEGLKPCGLCDPLSAVPRLVRP
jgi:hypothetical protein